MKAIVAALAVGTLAVAFSSDAQAMPQFKKAFTKKFVEKHKSKEFQSMAKKASCNVCHVKGPKKDVQNEYGKLLNKLIEGDANKRYKDAKKTGPSEGKAELEKILSELDKAFDKAGEMKSEAGKGPKFGEIIKAGKLPVDPAKAVAKYKEEKAKAAALESAE